MSYTYLAKPLLFSLDAEQAHNFTLKSLSRALKVPGAKSLLQASFVRETPELSKEIWGLKFKNPVGLAAGLDKDGIVGTGWAHLGFGFVELGTVTPRPQVGNPKKRLFRLPQDKALINRMGFNNAGVEALAQRLEKATKEDIILGANIGKNKDTPNESAVEDYLTCFKRLKSLVDYFVVNVSSPNTPGLRTLQEREPLTKLLGTLQEHNTQQQPILLKIAPDLTHEQVAEIVEVVQETALAGIVATNTTISREGLSTTPETLAAIGAGGLSGRPLTQRSHDMIQEISQLSRGKIPLVGVGGIMEGKDAAMRLASGASLVQVYSGLVYKGPALVKEILASI